MLTLNGPLHDRPLSVAEELVRAKEDNARLTRRHDLPGQRDFVERDPRIGRALHSSEFLRRLRRAVPDLYVHPGQPGQVGLYRAVHGAGELQYVCGMPLGDLPEYSIAHLDAKGVAKREERGWRTVLLRFIVGRHTTESRARRIFGEPSNGVVAKHWRRQLFESR